MVDVQNTLVNLAFNQWGTEEQKQKYLTKLSTVFFSFIQVLTNPIAFLIDQNKGHPRKFLFIRNQQRK